MTKRASRQLVSKIRVLMISRLLEVLKAFVIQILPRVGARANIPHYTRNRQSYYVRGSAVCKSSRFLGYCQTLNCYVL